MKRLISTVTIVAMMIASGTTASAQLGNLMKKAQEAAQKIEKAVGTTTGQTSGSTAEKAAGSISLGSLKNFDNHDINAYYIGNPLS